MKGEIETTALDWVIRQRDPAFLEWETFADWLAADPAHAAAYHRAQALDDDLAALPAAEPEIEPAPARALGWSAQGRGWSRRNVWLSAAIAASLVGFVTVSQFRGSTYAVETAMGERRDLTLADGSRIALNGGTRLLLDRRNDRRITLEQGQAVFTVAHSETAAFEVSVGQARLVDIGTVFDVSRSGTTTVVAVAEGAVAYNPDAENVRIDAGKRLAISDAGGTARLSAVDPASVGGWRDGQLVYDGVPLALVTQDIERTTGFRIRTDPESAKIPFRGALNVGADEARLAADLAALSGTRAVKNQDSQNPEGWTLSK